MGDDALVTKIDATEYPQYGAPILKLVCETLGLPIPDKASLRNMMVGKPCVETCTMGCEQGIMGTGIFALGFEVEVSGRTNSQDN